MIWRSIKGQRGDQESKGKEEKDGTKISHNRGVAGIMNMKKVKKSSNETSNFIFGLFLFEIKYYQVYLCHNVIKCVSHF